MTPDLEAIAEVIKAEIKKNVNGKIDRLAEDVRLHNQKHEEDMREVKEHIKEVKPILDAYNGSKVLGNLVKWLASVGVGVALMYSWVIK